MTGSQKILIVEDYEDIAVIYSFMLESNGYTVQVAKTGPEALEKVLSFEPDVMLLDIMIPGIDGVKVLETIRTQPKYAHLHPRVLMMSNLLQSDIAKKAEQNGADGYIVKANLKNQDLIPIIQELLTRPISSAGAPPSEADQQQSTATPAS